jgi:hypothetical protein
VWKLGRDIENDARVTGHNPRIEGPQDDARLALPSIEPQREERGSWSLPERRLV